MKFLKEWIDERINEDDFNFLDYNEFNNLEIIDKRVNGTLKKANWKNHNIIIVLKISNNLKIIENDFKEYFIKLKVLRRIDHSNINRFLGLTKDPNGNYFSVLEYANEGNLRDYLKINFDALQWNVKLQMALDITRGLMFLHTKKVIHGNLHSYNVLVNDVYVEPQYLHNSSYKRDMESDIYSLGVLLWEISSGRPPFSECIQKVFGLTQVKNKLLNGEKEEPVANTPSEYLQLYQKCWQDEPNSRPEINQVYEILSQIKLQSGIDNIRVTNGNISDRHTAKITLEIFKSPAQQIIRKLKLDHGIVLNGYDIISSLQGVVVEDGELKVNLYEESPLVYTSINSENNDLQIDTCINFPVAEIVYNGNLLESFLEYMNDEKKLHELCGDFLPRRFLAGGQLFIEDFNSVTTTQASILKYYFFCVYNSIKYSTEIQLSKLFTLNLLPKLITLDGERINTHEELINWMNNLYQKNMVNIISYDNLIPISRLKDDTSLIDGDSETFEEKQPGVIDFNEKLDFDDWTEEVVDDNLMVWAEDFKLFHGLIINNDGEIEISEKIPIYINRIPEANPRDKTYLKIVNQSTEFDFNLISNNIFSTINLDTFPFTRNNVINNNNNNNNHEDYNHVLIKCEKYEIFLDMKRMIKPTYEFEQVIEDALNNMRPLKALQQVFDEYGHLFSRRIVLGRSIKNIIPNFPSSNTYNDINDIDQILESLDNLNIKFLLTQKESTIEKDDVCNWIQDSQYLEVIEFDHIIPLYKILKEEQQKRIDDLSQNDYKILMTGITNLTDLNNNNNEHYKRVNFDLSLEKENYDVFGLIISEHNTKLEDIYINFGLYDFNGFYTIIKKGENIIIDITRCHILWLIIGNPSRSSIFSPNNRDFEINYLKKSIKLRSNISNYKIKTFFPLYEGYTVLIHENHSSINYEYNNIIKIIEWNERSIKIQIESNFKFEFNTISDINLSDRDSDPVINLEIELYICVISTNYKNLKIDNDIEREYPLNLIGHILIKENKYD
ncbi:unnamed protein product [Rhizophagus irregularis]|uniref:Protein kinase domain-containing protein n=3 Tax=Rhizophagus irregularis TaxID=588596 RepID=A0A915ZNH2_9GLOM|nr:unnamed protein product [Rhizophagus irregularis]